MDHPEISISLVSHAQGHLIKDLLSDLDEFCRNVSFELILTLNIPEELPFLVEGFSFPIKLIHNDVPMGFGDNHNQAFAAIEGDFFCVMNPDLRFTTDPFSPLLHDLKTYPVEIIAPMVLNDCGQIDDSARRFPTPFSIFCKAFWGNKEADYFIGNDLVFPDWVAGMFMLFSRECFERLNGFDRKFFLYYEDVDICARLRLSGAAVGLSPHAKVKHSAHRSSHHDLKYLRWHLSSLLRFFCSSVFLQICCQKLVQRIHR